MDRPKEDVEYDALCDAITRVRNAVEAATHWTERESRIEVLQAGYTTGLWLAERFGRKAIELAREAQNDHARLMLESLRLTRKKEETK